MSKVFAQPLKEVNGIKFGMKREDVRKIIGEAKEFKKSKLSKNTTDDFGYCHVFYNDDDECEAIEIFNNTEVLINETVVFPINISEIKTIIKDLVEEEGSFISKSQSIGIYAPNGNMESILFGNIGYYE